MWYEKWTVIWCLTWVEFNEAHAQSLQMQFQRSNAFSLHVYIGILLSIISSNASFAKCEDSCGRMLYHRSRTSINGRIEVMTIRQRNVHRMANRSSFAMNPEQVSPDSRRTACVCARRVLAAQSALCAEPENIYSFAFIQFLHRSSTFHFAFVFSPHAYMVVS